MRGAPLLLILAAAKAWGHIEPIYPVNISLRAYEDQVILRIDVPAEHWKSEILGADVSGSAWPEDPRKKAKNYVASHLAMKLDDKPLALELIGSRYESEPWYGEEGGRLFFDLRYRFPARGGSVLNGRSAFYDEDWTPKSRRPTSVSQEFVANIDIQGRTRRRLTVPYEQPDFRIPLRDALRTTTQRIFDNILAGAAWLWDEPAALFWAVSAALFFPTKRAAVRTAALFGAVLNLFFWPTFPSPPAVLAWIAAALLAASAGSRFGERYWTGIIAVSAPVLGASMRAAALQPLLATPNWLTRSSFLIGGALALGSVVLILEAGLAAYKRHLKRESESLAEDLFIKHVRFVGSGLGIFCVVRSLQ